MAQQPQPNLQNLAQALIMVSNEVGNISNMPVIQINQQMNAITGMLQQQQQTLQQMQQMQQQMQQQQQQMQQQQQQMQQQMQQMQQQMQQLLQRLSVGEKRQIARVFNSSSQINVDPLPNDADILPDATFPTTRSVFFTLNSAAVNQWLNFYGLDVQGTLPIRRRRLLRFLGIPI